MEILMRNFYQFVNNHCAFYVQSHEKWRFALVKPHKRRFFYCAKGAAKGVANCNTVHILSPLIRFITVSASISPAVVGAVLPGIPGSRLETIPMLFAYSRSKPPLLERSISRQFFKFLRFFCSNRQNI